MMLCTAATKSEKVRGPVCLVHVLAVSINVVVFDGVSHCCESRVQAKRSFPLVLRSSQGGQDWTCCTVLKCGSAKPSKQPHRVQLRFIHYCKVPKPGYSREDGPTLLDNTDSQPTRRHWDHAGSAEQAGSQSRCYSTRRGVIMIHDYRLSSCDEEAVRCPSRQISRHCSFFYRHFYPRISYRYIQFVNLRLSSKLRS